MQKMVKHFSVLHGPVDLKTALVLDFKFLGTKSKKKCVTVSINSFTLFSGTSKL